MSTFPDPDPETYVDARIIIDPYDGTKVLHIGGRPYIAHDGLPFFCAYDIPSASDLNRIVDRLRTLSR